MIAIDTYLLESVKRSIAILCLSIASYQDIKSREVSDKVWLPIIVTSIIINAIEKVWIDASIFRFYLLSIAITSFLALTLAYLGLIGGADAKAYICLSILEIPLVAVTVDKLIPGISIFMNSVILSVFAMLIIVINNIILLLKTELYFPPNIGILKKIILFLSATIVDLNKVKDQPYKYFILSSLQNTVEIKISIQNMDNYMDIIESLEKKGIKKVWVSPTLPFILFIFIGYLLYLILGNIILYILNILF